MSGYCCGDSFHLAVAFLDDHFPSNPARMKKANRSVSLQGHIACGYFSAQ
jgi:hypothetical protein